ncbi:MAG: ATP-binding cassette domain-containing protein [Gemmatimonadota bacterium]
MVGRAAAPHVLEVDLRARVGTFRLEVRFRSSAGVTALFGPSGAGKTLTLRHLAGLEAGGEGVVRVGGRVVEDTAAGIRIPARERRIGMVFQEYALFPHLNVRENVGYGLQNLDREARRARVRSLLSEMGLEGFGHRRPAQLSGGEKQRVALARALAPEPDLLLLDEPFAALDFRVRRGLREALGELHRRTGVPLVLVTHLLEDVRRLSDHLVLLDQGRVVAAGPTRTLLADPPSPEAQALIGEE